MTNTVKIGRREFLYDTFTEAVKNTKTYSELCEALGMNKSVQTTLNTLKQVVKDLQLDISHYTYKYTISEKVGGQNIKEYNLLNDNQLYYDSFINSFDKKSCMQQYKSSCGDFLEKLGNKDFATITTEDIENYADSLGGSEQTIRNRKAHLRSMMIYSAKNDINGAFNKVSKEMLLYLI